MATIPSKAANRIAAGIKKFQPIVQLQKTRDVNESDTVTIIQNFLCEVLGYDRYSEITSEFAIKSTYCDLAIKLNNRVELLLEAKSIGTELKDQHVKQAIDYAANQGIDWVVLTNAINWRIYRVGFGRPISHELVLEFNLLELSSKSDEHIKWLFMIAKEGCAKSALGDFHTHQQALSRHYIAAVLRSESVLAAVRRELKKISPDARIEVDQIEDVLVQEVLKREVQEGEKADEARKKVQKLAKSAMKKAAAAAANGSSVVPDGSEENAPVLTDQSD